MRRTVRKAAPGAEETVLWGGLSYHRPWVGGRVKGSVCQITTRRGEVRIEFIHGIRLRDPSRLLQGNRLSKRYVPVHTVAEARDPRIVKLIKEASNVAFAGI